MNVTQLKNNDDNHDDRRIGKWHLKSNLMQEDKIVNLHLRSIYPLMINRNTDHPLSQGP